MRASRLAFGSHLSMRRSCAGPCTNAPHPEVRGPQGRASKTHPAAASPLTPPPPARDRPRSRAASACACVRPARRRSPRRGRAPRTRSTTRISTPMMCSTQTMVMPFSRADARSMSAACSISAWSRPLRLSSASSSCGCVASARASSSFFSAGGAEPVGRAARVGRQPDQSPAPPRRCCQQSARETPRSWPKKADSATFSSSVRLRNGRGIWKVRADALVADAVRRQPADLRALEADRAGGRRVEPGDAVEDRALARAVRADQAEDLALLDRRTRHP